jgi:hypothetical protein
VLTIINSLIPRHAISVVCSPIRKRMGTSSISRAFDDPKIALTIAAASTFAALLLWQLRRQKYYASYNSAPSPPIKKPWVLGHIPDLLRYVMVQSDVEVFPLLAQHP